MPECGDDLPENGRNTDDWFSGTYHDKGNSDLDYEVNELMYNVFGDYWYGDESVTISSS